MKQVRVTEAGSKRLNLPKGTVLWVKESEINERGVALRAYSGGKTFRWATGMATVKEFAPDDPSPSLELV